MNAPRRLVLFSSLFRFKKLLVRQTHMHLRILVDRVAFFVRATGTGTYKRNGTAS